MPDTKVEPIVTALAQDQRPSKDEAMEAVKTLIRWAGDDPSREGLLDTPKRVVDSYKGFFKGYNENPRDVLARTFEDVQGYDDMVLLKNMRFESHCEHHMVPIIGVANIAYLPNDKVVGISKLARLLDIFAKRLQTQELMTLQIAKVIDEVLEPKGVAVYIDAEHQCMTTRGAYKPGTTTVTSYTTGVFRNDPAEYQRFMQWSSTKPSF